MHWSQLRAQDNNAWLQPELAHAEAGLAGVTARRFAVLFKIFFWDDFVARQLAALSARCVAGDIWVVVDDTHGFVDGITHSRIFRTRETDMVRLGLADYPSGKLNWYNADYQLLAFNQAHPDYRHYVMIEHDAVVQRDLDTMMTEIEAGRIDFVATPSRTPIREWDWVFTLEEIWARDAILHQLLFISVFSNRAVAELFARRRHFAARFASGALHHWPFCEGFVPTVLRDAGFAIATIDRFGSTNALDWWPPFHESDLPALAGESFVHPVLTGQRYVASLLRFQPPEAWFVPGSLLRRKLDREAPDIVVAALIEAFSARQSNSGLIALGQAVKDMRWDNCSLTLEPLLRPARGTQDRRNLAVGRFAYQSSSSAWSRGRNAAEDAAHGLNGVISGDYGFHTDREIQPWWMVDLGRPCWIDEIRLFNRLSEDARRANRLSVWRSANGRGWDLVHRHADNTPFGGADGRPLAISCAGGTVARFIRIELDGLDYLHLDEVEVWGVELPSG